MSRPASLAAWGRGAPALGLLWRIAPDVLPALALVLLATASHFPGEPHARADLLLLALVLPIALRRVAPVSVLLVVGTVILLSAASTTSLSTDVAAIALASYTVGERALDRARSLAVVIFVAACLTAGLLAQDVRFLPTIVVPWIILLPAWLAGDVVRGRRLERVARAQAAEREIRAREAALRASVAEERRHVARELHDVVAHSVSVMLIQAGAARQVLRSAPNEAETALRAVETTGRETMAELRTLLGALGDASEPSSADGAGLAPQPGLDRVGELVARVRDAGLPVTLQTSGAARRLAPGVDVTAYRIVQEALTNALRYAAGASTLVQVAYEASQLRLEVLDAGPDSAPDSQGSGAGLAGLRERAALAGGHVEAGPRIGGGWAVRAWLPLAGTDG